MPIIAKLGRGLDVLDELRKVLDGKRLGCVVNLPDGASQDIAECDGGTEGKGGGRGSAQLDETFDRIG